MAAPKSRIKIGLDDDPTKGLNQAASLPGRGAGSSSPRDVQDVGVLRSGGVVTSTDELELEPGAAEAKTPAVIDPKAVTPATSVEFVPLDPKRPSQGGSIIDNRTGKPAVGWINVPGQGIILASSLTEAQFSGIVARAQDTATGTPFQGETGPGGVPLPPGFFDPSGGGGPELLPTGEGAAPTKAEPFDLNAFLLEFGIGGVSPTGTARATVDQLAAANKLSPVQEAFKAILDAEDPTGLSFSQRILELVNDPNLQGLLGVASVPLTQGLLGTLSPESAAALRNQSRVGFGTATITDLFAGTKRDVGVLIDLETQLPLTDLDGEFVLAPGAEEAIRRAGETRTLLLESAEAAQAGTTLAPDKVTARQTILEAAIAAEVAAVEDTLRQTGTRIQAVLESALLGGREEAQRGFEKEERVAGEAFETTVLNTKAINDFKIRAADREHDTKLREMELAWINGSPEEAAAARRQAQDIDRRRIVLEERSILINVLSVLGQNPQLRGLIQALGLFDGQIVGGDFDLGAFFSGEVPPGEIPSAQEFSRMTPAQQENLVNDLAGKFGISPEIIVATIRQSAPLGVGRLR